MEHKRPKETILPRIYLISSGEENTDNDSILLNQLNLLPRSIPSWYRYVKNSSKQKSF